MAMLDQIAEALVTAGVGQQTTSADDWFIYKGYLQDKPDRAIALYETAGRQPETSFAIDYPGFQVRVRGNPNDYQAVRAKMQAAFLTLQTNEADIGANVVVFEARSGVIPLGQDEARRPSLVQNYGSMINRDQP